MPDTTDDRLQRFAARYAAQETPWDTGITPPEIVAIAAEMPPGRALDLGCGTGTNLRYLLERGWQADGVDFVPQAVELARRKLAAFPPGQGAVYCHDVTRLDALEALRPPYDLAIDIGCGHGLPADEQASYAQRIAALLRPGGTLMLYAHFPEAGRNFGWTADDVRRLFTPLFELIWQSLAEDTTTDTQSGWYRLVRRPAAPPEAQASAR